MSAIDMKSRFEAKLLHPAKSGDDTSWAFVILPREASERLPRRGRTTVEGTINGHHFQATLEPDGQLSHWFRVSRELHEAAGAAVGDIVTLELVPVKKEPSLASRKICRRRLQPLLKLLKFGTVRRPLRG